ncbi:MAG: DUF501 domain-containing protein [Coriobacteriia bacterium]|nr:DUF501 domain-containing protein [Coriobacteriia bacterium]
MHRPAEGTRTEDSLIVTAQLEREPRVPWRVATRCRFGRPSTIASPPRLADGTPFPTLFWLTCPWLVRRVGEEESRGSAAQWAKRLAEDSVLAQRLEAADSRYRELRAAEGGGDDPCADVGIAGQREPIATKCLHAHVAAYLAGTDDPVGEAVVCETEPECDDDRCSPQALESRGLSQARSRGQEGTR